MSNVITNSKKVISQKFTTTDYSIFCLIAGNRPVDISVRRRKDLAISLKEHGWLSSAPATVVEDNKRLFVVDGQHRIAIAKALKLPVVFEVLDITLDQAKKLIADFQAGTKWDCSDYIRSYSCGGNQDYIAVSNFAKENLISASQAAALLSNEQTLSHRYIDKLKRGTYTVRNYDYASKTIAIANVFEDFKNIWRNRVFIIACSKIALVKDFNILRLQQKVNTHPYLVKKMGTCDGYLNMIGDVYNRQSHDKIDLQFLAKMAVAKKRGRQ